VRSGNLKTAGHLVNLAMATDGYGFNKVHLEVLTAKQPDLVLSVPKASLTKKNVGFSRSNRNQQGLITPLHCACINPNVEFIKAILNKVEDYSFPDDILRKPVHYAAACEGPEPL